MKLLLTFTIITAAFLSCKSKTDTPIKPSGIQILISDTTNNTRAQWDWNDLDNRSKIEKRMGLTDLKKGADSLEIRMWYDFSFFNSKELYVLKFQDSTCRLSYYRFYPSYLYYPDGRMRQYTDPILDSFVCKSLLLKKDSVANLHPDSIWLLKSQSALPIPESIGFTDCDSYILEIADKNRFKYLRHHCPMSYFNETKLQEIATYYDFCTRIIFLAQKFDAIVPHREQYQD